MNRRTFLASTLALSGLQPFGQLWASPSNTNFLLVFLRGGYDATNLLVPFSSDFYYHARPNIAIPKPSNDPKGALNLDGTWGLHPSLRETIFPLYQKGQVSFVPFAGTDDLSRSHFETQDNIELGQQTKSVINYRSGFLNRLVETLGGQKPLSFTEQLPIIFQGQVPIPNAPLNKIGKASLNDHQSDLIRNMYQHNSLAGSVNDGFAVRSEVNDELNQEMNKAGRNAVSAKGFELEAQRIARLMKEGHRIGFVDVGGWDTHVGEGNSQGYLAGHFDDLGRGLTGFANEMGSEWKNTVVIVISEFGRTFRENGNRGTDHGHGSVYWILGGSINGKRIAGEQVAVSESTLFQNRDYLVLNNYRNLLGGLFKQMYDLKSDQVQQIFPGSTPQLFNLI